MTDASRWLLDMLLVALSEKQRSSPSLVSQPIRLEKERVPNRKKRTPSSVNVGCFLVYLFRELRASQLNIAFWFGFRKEKGKSVGLYTLCAASPIIRLLAIDAAGYTSSYTPTRRPTEWKQSNDMAVYNSTSRLNDVDCCTRPTPIPIHDDFHFVFLIQTTCLLLMA